MTLSMSKTDMRPRIALWQIVLYQTYITAVSLPPVLATIYSEIKNMPYKTRFPALIVMKECYQFFSKLLQWRHDNRDVISNHRRLDCLPNRLFKHISKKTSKLRVTGLCEGNLPVTGEVPAQMACNAQNVSIWWRHHALLYIVHASWKCEIVYCLRVWCFAYWI